MHTNRTIACLRNESSGFIVCCLSRSHWLVIAAIVFCVAAPQAGALPPPKGISHPPRSIRYVPATDELIDQPSSIAPRYRRPDSLSTAYYGNRLTEYRWVGPRGRGGMYEFFAEEAARKKLDIESYRYRAGRRF
jgi:hypothetical protein